MMAWIVRRFKHARSNIVDVARISNELSRHEKPLSEVAFDGLRFDSPVAKVIPKDVLTFRASYGPLAPAPVSSPLQRIGCTPLLNLAALARECGLEDKTSILAKLESSQLSGSAFDRTVLEFFRLALQEQFFHEGSSVQSGNTKSVTIFVIDLAGATRSFSLVCPLIARQPEFAGFRFEICKIPVPSQTAQPMGQITVVDYMSMRAEAYRQFRERCGSDEQTVQMHGVHFLTNSSRTAMIFDPMQQPYSLLAGFRHLGPEIWDQSAKGEFEPDAFVDFVGSGATYSGVLRFLRSVSPYLKGYVAEPQTRMSLRDDGRREALSMISGHGGYGLARKDLEHTFKGADWTAQYLPVSAKDAVNMKDLLLECEGIECDLASAATVTAAVRIARDGLARAPICIIKNK